jgi:hypothetical protein
LQFLYRASKKVDTIAQLSILKKEAEEFPFHVEITACLFEASLAIETVQCICPHCDGVVNFPEETQQKCPSCSKDCAWEQIYCSSTVVATFEDKDKELFDALLPSSVLNFLPELTGDKMNQEKTDLDDMFSKAQLCYSLTNFRLILEINNWSNMKVYDATPSFDFLDGQ